ncbi:putative ubiquitin homeostasis protein lub1 protein [Phaeoacremonium minimum UCRPA7]|uniref:Putative ubiquitin homeostasis protein lub1 protein n=1 Tax=Phaeoacremonium minimum (strain UCR-PA7) TaxID=1286976 RepID=R8BFY8_PHAM7|nr:putative ubiquitin homeostasis protein lub1 protein [Phaeoacremonium minimum UCRPA7]EON98204.1 putative ubiquitin homeostasis protein lub1 protein [Phaeoacremonium minimum UCRPA7]
MPDFKLSAQLSGHDSDVRAVAFPSPDAVISASRDNTVRVWRKTTPKPPAFEPSITTQGQEFINSLAFLGPSSEYPDGLIISGGKDTIIEVKKATATPSDNAERLLIGHGHNVCALDVSPKGTYIVSGGWDSQAIVWRVGKWEPEIRLEDHSASVWGVLAYDENTVITGCADEKIRIFDLQSGSGGQVYPRSTIYTPDVVRAICKVPQSHSSGADIASAHNDGVIRLWKLNGQAVGELHGHESFVYSLAALPSGELVSSGEDRTVRIWRDQECIQTITHPAISVWSVAVSQQSGDIVSGASDGVIRVFTRSEERLADEEAIRLFEEAVKSSSIPQQQVGGINKEKLPGPEFLQTRSGTKEGQVQMIKEDNGAVTAHQWSMSQQQWINVGTVVDAVGSSGKKVEYNGQSYDYVFDVDIEDGKPPLKLPYNLSENPYDRATKFLGDNELPLSYLDNVANFIIENTKGATLGQSAGPTTDEFGTGRYQPGANSASESQQPQRRVLPQENYLLLAQAKFDPVFRKINSINATMLSAGRKDYALNPTEEATLKQLTASLTAAASSVPTTISATASSSNTLTVSEEGLALVLKLVTQWPDLDRLPGLDLLRCISTSPAIVRFQNARYGSVIEVVLNAAFNVQNGKINENCVMMAFRALANLFATEPGRALAVQKASDVVGYMEGVVGIDDSIIKGPIGHTNRNVLIALTTTIINYAVLAHASQKRGIQGPSVDAVVVGLMGNVLGKILQEQTDSEVIYRALAALGTVAAIGGEYKSAVTSFGAEAWVKTATGKASEDRVKDIAKECLALLR